jgi:chitin synthase
VFDNRDKAECSVLVREKRMQATTVVGQNVAWQWAVIFAFAVPEVGTWLRAVRLCFFKKVKNFGAKDFCVVLVVESLHVVGMCLLAFAVLPEMDALQGAMLTNCLCFVPGVLCEFWFGFNLGFIFFVGFLNIFFNFFAMTKFK